VTPDNEYLRADVNGVPVVSTPAEIDVTTADLLQAVLIEAASGDERIAVVDLSRSRFCDSAGLNTILRAHLRLAEQGRELRVVIPATGAVPRALQLIGMDRYLRCFASLEQALTQPRKAATPPEGTPRLGRD
jgi:anti-anti-sigma factor